MIIESEISSKDRLHRKLLNSHLSVASFGFAVLCVALVVIWIIGSNSSQLAKEVGPIAQSSQKVYSGIQASLAAMRGWVALGDDEFRDERRQAWQQVISPAMAELQSILKKSSETEDSDELQRISGWLKDLEMSQWWIEDVAQTPGNDLARYYFDNTIQPVKSAIENYLSAIIILQSLDAEDVKKMQVENNLFQFQYYFNQSVASLEQYINSPSHLFEKRYVDNLKDTINKHSVLKLLINEFSVEQRKLLQKITVELNLYEKFSSDLIRIRNKPEWNTAQYRLNYEAVPLARQLLSTLKVMSARHTDTMRKQADHIQELVFLSAFVMTILIILMTVITIMVSRRSSQRLSQPIIKLSEAASQLTEGQFVQDLEIDGRDEIATLTKTFNHMRHSIQTKNNELEEAKQILEKRVTQRTEELARSRDLAETTLYSIGDAVITTDTHELITMMNPIAEQLTGWVFNDVKGNPLSMVFKVVNEETQSGVECPVGRCLQTGEKTVLASDSNLICRDGSQVAIDDSASPIHAQDGVVIGAILVFRDVTRGRKLQKKLSYQAIHDSLTGLVNRREFESRVERLLSTIEYDRSEHALCYLDLDQFKVVNDTCGHTAGDELLQQISQLLQSVIRNRDTLARLGGDEFGVLMEHCSIKHAERVSNSILSVLNEYQFLWEGKRFKVGASIGLLQITEETGSLSEVLKRADAACYMAKEGGRNRIHLYQAKDTALAQRHGEMQWVAQLNQALDENRFCLYAQSIMSLNSGRKKHYEILLRLIDDDGKIIPPGAFLPAAERYDLISNIDCWVIENSFDLLADNPEFLKQIDFCSINLSGQSLSETKILNFIIDQLDKFDMAGEKICFEITETAAISNLSKAIKFISTLKGLGCRFALDDFGSGLSSFGYLKNLPVDYLKIDGIFVKDIVDDPIDRAMVKSINEIGHVIGMKTIAEFVENDMIIGMLKDIGVDYAQGYGIDKPQPLDELLSRSDNVTNIRNSETDQYSS